MDFVASLIAAALAALPAGAPTVIPRPSSMTVHEGAFTLSANTVVQASGEARMTGEQLRAALASATGFALKLSDHPPADANTIELRLDPSANALGEEGYRLTVTPAHIAIAARRPAGLFYGVQTLRQLLPTQVFSPSLVKDVAWTVPAVEIEDVPRFGWRGSHLDVGRHFMPKDWVLRYIDLLAMHKLNTLHFHLTEDQGWRIEIKKYPELTRVGAWRKDSMLTYSPPTFSGEPHGGFYTQDELREIVAYAAARHINVVPEIEMPGHAQAAISAYPQLGNTGKAPGVRTEWGVSEDVFNVEEPTIQFLFDVLDEVLAIFPSRFIHIGGDECPKVQWKASPRAQAKIKELGLKDEHELQSWFIRRMDEWLDARGRRLIGWDEILEGGLAEGAAVMSWRGEAGGIAAAKAGHDVVMTPGSHTYFDHYQSRTSGEPHAIGGFTPLSKVYEYEPIPAELTADEAKHVLGAQYQLWTEYMRDSARVEYMAFPRACAMSEVLWSPREGRDYPAFLGRLTSHLTRLDLLQVNYRKLDETIERAAARWQSGQVGEDWTVLEWPLNLEELPTGETTVVFQYSHGAHRLDVDWAELVANGKVIARDEHDGRTGGEDVANAYRFSVPELPAGSALLLRVRVKADGGSDSNGEVFVRVAQR